MSFDGSLKVGKNSRNRIWGAVEVEVFLLPAVAPNQGADGDEVPVAAARVARAAAALGARKGLRKNRDVGLKADVPQL